MAQFSVKTGQARVQIDEEKRMAGELREYEASVRYAGNHLSMKSASSANIKARLKAAAQQIDAQQNGMSSMYSALERVISSYEKAEQRIYSNADGKGNLTIKSIAAGIFDAFQNGEQAVEDIIKQALEAIANGSDPAGIIAYLGRLQEYIANVINGSESGVGLLIELPDLVTGGIDAINALIDQVKDTIIDKTGFDLSAGIGDSWYNKEWNCEHGSLGVTAGAYNAYVSAEGGIFTTDDDGNLVFNPNIDAQMGASFTALEIVGNYAIGNDLLGAAASGHITVGQVSAEAGLQANLMGSDGSFDPHLHASASAEAILVEAEAQAGVTVLGTDVEVTGSVYVGAGVHADFEFGDGTISCDLGAALGIGASISLEIDYGGTIDAVKDVAESVLSGAKDALFGWLS